MDNKLAQHYEAIISMFASQGWKELLEQVDEIIEATDRISPITDEKQLWFKKGELANLVWIKNLEEEYKAAYQQLKDEDNAHV